MFSCCKKKESVLITGKLDDRVGWRGQYRGFNERYMRRIASAVRSAIPPRPELAEPESVEVLERLEAATLRLVWPLVAQTYVRMDEFVNDLERENDALFADRIAGIRYRLGLDNGADAGD